MYLDITAVSYDSNNNTVTIEGTDLDSVLLNDWNKKFPKSSEATLSFDLTKQGNRIYLYKLVKTQVKEEYKTMEQALLTLVGKIINISGNFKV